MARRNFIPTLAKIAHRFCQYAARYRDTLIANMTPTQRTLFDAALAACLALGDALEHAENP